MSFNVNFLKGSSTDRDLTTSHLLTGIISRKVVDNVVDMSRDILDVESRRILRYLWTENMIKLGGLPVLQQQIDDTRFDFDSLRQSKLLSEPLPPIVAKGLLKKPDIFMQRPILNAKQSNPQTEITECYVLKSV
jgi:hypothetical protein